MGTMMGTLLEIVPIDQLYFLLAEVIGLCCGFLYRNWDDYNRPIEASSSGTASEKMQHLKSPSNNCQKMKTKTTTEGGGDSATKRNIALLAMIIPGLMIAYLCYGSQILHLVILAISCYISLLVVPAQYVHYVTLVVAMGHLSVLHIDRLVHDYTIYTVDITAPVMVLVQKVTSVALCLYDGEYRAKQKKDTSGLTADQKANALTRLPTPLEYGAYVFNFQTIVCGPMVYFADFIDFVDGGKLKKDGLRGYPSARNAIAAKLAQVVGCALLIVTFSPMYPTTLLTKPIFTEASFLSKLMLMYWVALAARLKYYLAWTLSESICQASGLGFGGLDEKTKEPRWDLMNNIDIYAFENALSQRDGLLVWNKTTEAWLRRTAYERAPPKYKLVGTYILSAFWHGFHPGYYLTFLTAALFTYAARVARRCLRFRFQARGPTIFTFYHLLTWITTRIAMNYMILPFILLDFINSLHVYWNLYLCGHLGATILIFALPLVFAPERAPSPGGRRPGGSDGKATSEKIVSGDQLAKGGKMKAASGGSGGGVDGGGGGSIRRRQGPPRIEESVSEKMSKYGAT